MIKKSLKQYKNDVVNKDFPSDKEEY